MTNKKFKLAAMSLALTACVAASPLAANAESADAGAGNSAPAATAEVPGENAPATNETKQGSTDETKQESTNESKQESTGESKQESTNESKQESTDETKQESTDETKQESTNESKQESTGETKQESTGETKQESTNESKQESTDESKQESTGESKQESTNESKQESTNESKQESTNESKQESTDESKQESTNESKQESTDESKQESTDESKQESTGESKQESTGEAKQESTNEAKPDTTNENKPEVAAENKDLAAVPVAKAPVLMAASLAAGPEAPTGAPTAPAEAKTVAILNGTGYKSFDEAVSKANDNDIIEVIEDTETDGMELKKNLTIQGVTKTTTKTNDDGTVEETTVKPKLTFKKKGIALWGTDLTFKDMRVEMDGVGSTPYTAEYGWAHSSICSSGNSKLTLDKTDMVMDGTKAGSGIYAIYLTGNDVLDVKNSSTLTINDYSMNALTWDGGDGGYNCNITGGSTFISDHNRSGFTGTFYVTVDHSDVKVINSRGNGSNGSHYDIKNGSNVNFSGNGSHGLSAGNLTVQDSTVTAENNGLTGIIFTGKGEISDHSTVTITGTKGKSYWNAGLRLMKSNASLTIKDSTVTIKDNAVTGIFCDSGSQLTIEDTANVTITDNTAAQKNCTSKQDLAQKGGGLVVRGGASAKLGANTTINNNSAAQEGADIFIEPGGTLTFSAGNAGIGDILKDCGDGIDGWYIDAEGQRWNFHGDPSVAQKLLDSKDVTLAYNSDGTYTITAGREGLALKAAHAELPAPEPDPNPNPNPDPEPKPDPKPGPDTPVTPEDPQLPPVQDARVDTPDSPVLPANPTNPAVQDAHALPQTGTSLFAALAMALSGFALTIAGAWASLLGKNSRH